MNPLVELQKLGQSIWYDNIRRGLLVSGELKKLIDDGEICGVTSNPSIFEKAIAGSSDYDDALHALVDAGKRAPVILDALAIEDIRATADLLRPVYDRSNGGDGYASIEVSPLLANDTATTVSEARRIWKEIDRPNLMVKIPATPAGVPAITQAIADGLNINVTLIFSLRRYEEVTDAYLTGLEKRAAAGKPIDRIASVASFFVSRVDSLIDPRLEALVREEGPTAGKAASVLGKAAIANAKLAYAKFEEIFNSPRSAALKAKGARVQRPLWASTSTKNPAYPDVFYVEALIGPDTVDTVPPATINAYRDHGKPRPTLREGLDAAHAQLKTLAELGINMDAVTQKLEDDGVAAFSKSFESLIAVIEAKREKLLAGHVEGASASLPKGWQARIVKRLKKLDGENFAARLWAKDPTLWTDDKTHHAEIRERLGWLTVPEMMESRANELVDFADEARHAGFTHAALLGMGGSSLCPEVLRESFGVAHGYLDLAILDSTDPAQVRAVEARSDPARTLYIVASKSGSTTEPNMFFAYFWDKVRAIKGEQAGENFIAITDPGTRMERVAREHHFRRVFLNPPDIGGRYSALSFFGLVPAALIGVNVAKLLDHAERMVENSAVGVAAHDSGGLWLGAIMGEAALAGRDKVTLICSKDLRTFGYWVEQLIAESTGKSGKGIVPVEGEPVGTPDQYDVDRLFVYLRLTNELDAEVKALADAGHPVVTLELDDLYDMGGEFFRWEVATAVAGSILRIDAFDQPNVQESKDNTVRLLGEYQKRGTRQAAVPMGDAAWQSGATAIYAKGAPAKLKSAKTLAAALTAHLSQI
ncbi:MAG: bifunctional transaldolase/phosoglucose isomerase, partial [Chloroflexi bacterium]|nr:bifunctional transaldolase/phosoglucose isomerase [Chloroflexota bacterium]